METLATLATTQASLVVLAAVTVAQMLAFLNPPLQQAHQDKAIRVVQAQASTHQTLVVVVAALAQQEGMQVLDQTPMVAQAAQVLLPIQLGEAQHQQVKTLAEPSSMQAAAVAVPTAAQAVPVVTAAVVQVDQTPMELLQLQTPAAAEVAQGMAEHPAQVLQASSFCESLVPTQRQQPQDHRLAL